jgi:CheY-like chemotaxis protein
MSNKPTILVIDDNAPFRMLIRAFLQKEDYQVAEAENGEQALKMLDNVKPDLLLLDLQMVPIGGFDFMAVYTERGYKSPVILITGDPSTDILERSSKLGIAGIVKKPITEERLMQIVKRFA